MTYDQISQEMFTENIFFFKSLTLVFHFLFTFNHVIDDVMCHGESQCATQHIRLLIAGELAAKHEWNKLF